MRPLILTALLAALLAAPPAARGGDPCPECAAHAHPSAVMPTPDPAPVVARLDGHDLAIAALKAEVDALKRRLAAPAPVVVPAAVRVAPHATPILPVPDVPHAPAASAAGAFRGGHLGAAGPGEHSHRCPQCGTVFSHGPDTPGGPSHDCPNCGHRGVNGDPIMNVVAGGPSGGYAASASRGFGVSAGVQFGGAASASGCGPNGCGPQGAPARAGLFGRWRR